MLKTKKHFTIIELLVVIAIISILAALILGGISSARESARQTQAKTDIQMLAGAIEAYQSTYKSFPFPTGTTVDETTEYKTDGTGTNKLIMEGLQGDNVRKQIFHKSSKAEIKDPWGNYYKIYFDANYDNNIADLGDGDSNSASESTSGKVFIWTKAKDNEYIRSWTTDVD